MCLKLEYSSNWDDGYGHANEADRGGHNTDDEMYCSKHFSED